MKKVMSLVAVFAMSSMLAGCYSKACEEPMPAPMPYKDSAPMMAPAQEEARPVHHYKKRHHYKHRRHRKAAHTEAAQTDNTQSTTEQAPAETTAQ